MVFLTCPIAIARIGGSPRDRDLDMAARLTRQCLVPATIRNRYLMRVAIRGFSAQLALGWDGLDNTSFTGTRSDEEYMRQALAEAAAAEEAGEVPVGAVLLIDGEVKGRGHNMVISTADPTAHAEMMAIRNAARG